MAKNKIQFTPKEKLQIKKTAMATGLTPGVTYWFDMQLAQSGSGNTSMSNVDCSVISF